MAAANEAPREHQLSRRVRLLVITANGDEPGQVHADAWVTYAYTDDGTPYWTDSDGAGGLAASGVLDVDPAGLPSGVLEHRTGGSQVLATVDGYRIELDGRGGCQVWDPSGTQRPLTGVFYVNSDPRRPTS